MPYDEQGNASPEQPVLGLAPEQTPAQPADGAPGQTIPVEDPLKVTAAVMEKYVPDEQQLRLIDNNFVYHDTKGDQGPRYVRIRSEAKKLAMTIVSLTPKTRESGLAITKLEECVMWANAAIARNE